VLDLPVRMRAAGQENHVLLWNCCCMWARQDNSAVIEAGMPVVGIVVCAGQTSLLGVIVCLFHIYSEPPMIRSSIIRFSP
jgi:hypothetical protein